MVETFVFDKSAAVKSVPLKALLAISVRFVKFVQLTSFKSNTVLNCPSFSIEAGSLRLLIDQPLNTSQIEFIDLNITLIFKERLHTDARDTSFISECN